MQHFEPKPAEPGEQVAVYAAFSDESHRIGRYFVKMLHFLQLGFMDRCVPDDQAAENTTLTERQVGEPLGLGKDCGYRRKG